MARRPSSQAPPPTDEFHIASVTQRRHDTELWPNLDTCDMTLDPTVHCVRIETRHEKQRSVKLKRGPWHPEDCASGFSLLK